MVSLCLPSWCPVTAHTIFLGFLLPWTCGISSQLLQQSAPTSPYLIWGVSPHCHPSWLWPWNRFSRPSCTSPVTAAWTWGCSSCLGAAPDLGHWVVPPSHRSWPQKLGSSSRLPPHPRTQTWGSSSRPLPLGHGVLLAFAPDLGRGTAPLVHRHSRSCLCNIYTCMYLYMYLQ